MTEKHVLTLQQHLLFLFLFLLSVSSFSQTNLFEHFSKPDGLPSEKVYDAVQTSDGNIWFASAKGVCRFNGIKFECFMEEQEITGLYLGNKLWCWNASSQLYYFENNRFSPFKTQAIDKIINSISVDDSSNLWVSTVIAGNILKISPDLKIEEINPGKYSFFIKQVGEKSFVFGSLKTSEPNNKLQILLNENPFTVSLSEKGDFSKSSFFPLENDEFFYAKGQEIVHVKNGKIVQRSFTGKNIEKIIVDSEGKIWAGLYTGGAICYPEGKLENPTSYLGNKSVTSIIQDNSGYIWLTTLEDGIYSVRPNLIYSVPKIYSDTSRTTQKALASDVVLPERNDSLPPAVYVTGIKIMEQDTAVQEHYTLPYDKNFLKIYFAGFSSGGSIKYKYKMEGVEKAWIYTDNTFAQYTTLPAGKYIFTVSAMNKHGIWSDSPVSVSFEIHPPVWRTWWFVSLMFLFLAGIISAIFIVRVKQIKKREKEKAEIAKQMANIQLQALRAQMNPHFIFNTLSSIQHFITTSETEAALKYLSKFAKLMRKIMDNSKKPVIPVKDEVELLQLYLELEALRFKNKFEYSIIVDEKIDDDEIPAMLIQPYAENAILHGLLAKGGKLEIKIAKQNEMIICTVEDNGIGRKKAQEIKKQHTSIGMSITKNRLEILNKMHNSNLSVNVTDLTDEHQNPAGTKVEIFIPVE